MTQRNRSDQNSLYTRAPRWAQGLTLTALCALLGCGKEDEAQAPAPKGASLSLMLTESTNEGMQEDSAGAPFYLLTARAYIRQIELDLPDGERCDELSGDLIGATCEAGEGADEDKIVIEGPRLINLINGDVTPPLTDVLIPEGRYKRVDIRFDDGRPDEGLITEEDMLNDRSLDLSFGFDHDEELTLLSVRLKFNEDLRVEAPEGVEVADGDALIAQLDVTQWLQMIDFFSCVDGEGLTTNGPLVFIDDDEPAEGSCAGIEGDIKELLKERAQLDKQTP